MKNYNNLNFEKDKIINYYKFLIYLIPAFIVIETFINGVVILGLFLLIYVLFKYKSFKIFDKKNKINFNNFFIFNGFSHYFRRDLQYRVFCKVLKILPFLIVLYFLFNTDKSFEISLLKIFNIILIFI